MRRFILLTGVVLLAAVLAIYPAQADAQKVVKIGKPAPISGPGAKTGDQQVKGAQLAVDHINAKGGVNGVKLELVVADGKCVPLDAAQAAERLITRDGVPVLLDALCSSATLAMMPIAAREKVPIAVEESSADSITKQGNPYIFRTTPNNSMIADFISEYLCADLKPHNMAFVFEQTDWGRDGAGAVRSRVEKCAIKTVGFDGVDRSLINFLPIITKLKGEKAESVLVIALIPQGAQFLKQAQELKFKSHWVGFQQMMNIDMYNQAGDAIEGLLGYSFFEIAPKRPETVEFAKAYKEKFGRDPEHYAMHDYDTVMLIADAIKRGGPSKEGIYKGLKATKNFKAMAGTFNFDADGQVFKEGIKGFVVRWSGGKKVILKEY